MSTLALFVRKSLASISNPATMQYVMHVARYGRSPYYLAEQASIASEAILDLQYYIGIVCA